MTAVYLIIASTKKLLENTLMLKLDNFTKALTTDNPSWLEEILISPMELF